MARRRMGMADIKEISVAWDADESMSAIARRLGYARLTVRKYRQAAEHIGLTRGSGRRTEAGWDQVAQAAPERVAKRTTKQKPAAEEIAQHHAYLEQWVGQVHLSVLHQCCISGYATSAGCGRVGAASIAMSGATGRRGCSPSHG